MQWEEKLHLADVLCLYGLSRVTPACYTWLEAKEHRQLIVLEDTTPFASFEHPRAHLFFLPQGGEEEVFKQIAWEHLFLRFHYLPEEEGRGVLFALEGIQKGVHLIASERSDLRQTVVKNFLKNVEVLGKALDGRQLFGKFLGVPAIICGSGPSLAQNGEELRHFSDKAVLFGGGSALAWLAGKNIPIHFAAAIDPSSPKERFPSQFYADTPLIYQNRVDPVLLQSAEGPLVYLPDAGSSLVESHLSETLFFDGGWNVATLCTAFATALGCAPIIFVGMDFCAEAGQIYASGITPTEKEKELIPVILEGKEVHSKSDWLIAREWIEEFVHSHPETLFLNASEGGIGVPGVANISLKQVEEQHLQPIPDLDQRIESALGEITPVAERPLLRARQVEVVDSLKRIGEHCKTFLESAEKTFPAPLASNGACTLALFEIEEEIAYHLFLAPLWEIWEKVLLREGKGEIRLHQVLLLTQVLEGLNGKI